MSKRSYRVSLLTGLVLVAFSLPWMPRLLPSAHAGPQTEEVDRDFADDEEPKDRADLLRNLELARAEAEVDSMHLEIAERRLALVRELAAVSENKIAAAAYGLMRVSDYMDDHDAAEFLSGIANDTTNPAVQRLIQIRLQELEHDGDDRELRKQHLKELILAD
ncbi:MAG: hypothetical protein AAF497_25380 [Planctomycetota bacterium]